MSRRDTIPLLTLRERGRRSPWAASTAAHAVRPSSSRCLSREFSLHFPNFTFSKNPLGPAAHPPKYLRRLKKKQSSYGIGFQQGHADPLRLTLGTPASSGGGVAAALTGSPGLLSGAKAAGTRSPGFQQRKVPRPYYTQRGAEL
jgi:hypothetical protein